LLAFAALSEEMNPEVILWHCSHQPREEKRAYAYRKRQGPVSHVKSSFSSEIGKLLVERHE
jgi:hypothetical protein